MLTGAKIRWFSKFAWEVSSAASLTWTHSSGWCRPRSLLGSARSISVGSEALYRDPMPGLLTELADRARVLSITASSAIEGVIVEDADRARRIYRQATTLRT